MARIIAPNDSARERRRFGLSLPRAGGMLRELMRSCRFCRIAVLFLATLGLAARLAAAEGEPPRAARSVHLGYPATAGEVFYNEMAVEESVPGSYFMACGWDTGYFGIQELGRRDGELGSGKVVLFSVWDPTHGDDPSAVKPEDRVEVLYEGKGVRIRRFGGEGTGGQCMAGCSWKTGETNRFVVMGEVHSNRTAYTAWVWLSQRQDWWKLATFRTRTGGRPLQGYHSFVEDFRRDGRSATETRRARYRNGWVRTVKGDWTPLTRARFTASNATWEARDTIDAGLAGDGFFLATGGSIQMRTPLLKTIEQPAAPGQPPALEFLPVRPQVP